MWNLLNIFNFFWSKSHGASFEDKGEYIEIYTNIQKCTQIYTQIHKYINIKYIKIDTNIHTNTQIYNRYIYKDKQLI